MTEQLFNALKAIETLASGTIKVYGLPSGQGLDCRNDMALAAQLRLLLLKYTLNKNLAFRKNKPSYTDKILRNAKLHGNPQLYNLR